MIFEGSRIGLCMNYAYLITGGNLGNRMENLKNALVQINVLAGRILKTSSVYQTAAWGLHNQPDFLNQALLIETLQPAPDLLETILQIEKNLGRIRHQKFGSRTIDIDILFYNHDVIDISHLSIPHPQLPYRRFVLAPLAEIAPHYQHPVLLQSVAELLIACPDPLNVKKFSEA